MDQAPNRGYIWELSLVISLSLMWGYVAINRVGIGFILPPVVAEFQLELWQASLLISGTAATHALSGWWGGVLSDRLGRKGVLLVGMYASALFSAAFGACTSFLALFVTRDLVGLGEGVSYSAGQSSIAEETRPERRALYQGIFNAGYGVIGLGLAAWVMTSLAATYGWRWVYPILAIYGVIAITLVAMLLPARRAAKRSSAATRLTIATFFSEVRDVARVRGVVPVMTGTVLLLTWTAMSTGFGSLFLTRVRGFSLEEAGWLLAITGTIGFTGTFIVPAISDVVGRKPVVVAGAMVGGLAYVLFALGDLPTMALAVVLTVANACIGGISPILGATFLSELVPERRGAAIGINVGIASVVGTMVMPLVGGLAADRLGLMAPLVMAGVLIGTIAPIVAHVPETAPRVLARRRGMAAIEGREAAREAAPV